jgi:O-antigen/teichoic acid export membrane protein
LTWQLDKLLLAALSTPLAVGLFSAGYKFLEVMNPFTTNLTLPLYPVYSRLARTSTTSLYKAFGQSLKFLYVLGIPIAVILFVLSDRIVVLFFGEAYREAGEVLRVLAPGVILLLPTSVYGYVFTALGRQRIYTGCAAAALATNLLLDLLLIPYYSYMGAAVGTLVGQAILFLSGLMMLRQFGAGLTTLILMWRPALAGLVMGFLCWVVKELDFAALLFGIGSGIAAYSVVLFVLHTFSRQEITLLMEAMRVRLGNAVQ